MWQRGLDNWKGSWALAALQGNQWNGLGHNCLAGTSSSIWKKQRCTAFLLCTLPRASIRGVPCSTGASVRLLHSLCRKDRLWEAIMVPFIMTATHCAVTLICSSSVKAGFSFIWFVLKKPPAPVLVAGYEAWRTQWGEIRWRLFPIREGKMQQYCKLPCNCLALQDLSSIGWGDEINPNWFTTCTQL